MKRHLERTASASIVIAADAPEQLDRILLALHEAVNNEAYPKAPTPPRSR